MTAFPQLAVLAAARTPFCKAFTELADRSAVDLGCHAVTAAIRGAGMEPGDVDELVFGNVAGPPDAANVARVIALRSGIPQDRAAHTVNRNCGSGMESIVGAWQTIATGRARVVAAGGTESMSHIPLLLSREAAEAWTGLAKAKSWGDRLKAVAAFRPRHFKPIAGIELGLTDPVSGLNMGQTAEVLAEEFGIAREDQDAYAIESHRRAAAARGRCFLSGEIEPLPASGDRRIEKDNGIREAIEPEKLAKLRPIFRADGTVTPGNSCQLTDGAAAAVLVDAAHADGFDREPLGYVTAYAIAGCDPKRMGLGPVHATAKLLRQTGRKLDEFDLVEVNEAFAAQVIACCRAAESRRFCERELGLDRPLGWFEAERMNVHGGAIAIGHPVGATGMRLVTTLLRSLRESGGRRGLATLCIGGGQGMAMLVQTERD